MDVLREVRANGELLGPTEVARRRGLYLEPVSIHQSEAWVAVGILSRLTARGLVQRVARGQYHII